MAKVFLLVLLILLSPSSDVLASDDIGYKYYLKGDYQKALKVWTKELNEGKGEAMYNICLLYTSPSPRDKTVSRMPSSA